MNTITVRRSGGSLIMTIPQAYTDQNQIEAGEEMEVKIIRNELTIKPVKKRKIYSLEELIAGTPEENRAPGWESMPRVGREVWR